MQMYTDESHGNIVSQNTHLDGDSLVSSALAFLSFLRKSRISPFHLKEVLDWEKAWKDRQEMAQGQHRVAQVLFGRRNLSAAGAGALLMGEGIQEGSEKVPENQLG
jgi:hypothetical protein